MYDRLWSKIEASDPLSCWVFSGSATHNGYGQISSGGKTYKAHRVAYESVNGPVPEGLVINHLCYNRLCCNPLHLEAVTPRENVLYSPSALCTINAQKTHCLNGHLLNESNIMWERQGTKRTCRTCHRERGRAHYKKYGKQYYGKHPKAQANI